MVIGGVFVFLSLFGLFGSPSVFVGKMSISGM